MRRPITLTRRIVQLIAFFLLAYGGLQKIGDRGILPFVEAPEGFRRGERIALLEGPEYGQVFNTYLPIKSCRFLRERGMFRGCFLHFLSESITWLTPLRNLIPHLLLFVILAFLLGRFWCGWICPLGFISDLLIILRKRLGLGYFNLPELLGKILIRFRYVLLFFILLISLMIAFPQLSWSLRKQLYLSNCQMCPSRFIFPYLTGYPIVHTLTSPILVVFFLVALLFTLILVAGFFIRRLFCRICPSGLILSFFNRGSLLVKEKDVLKCTRCGICLAFCPMENQNVYEEKKKKMVNYPECIRCFRCVDSCPEKGCLQVKLLGKRVWQSQFKN